MTLKLGASFDTSTKGCNPSKLIYQGNYLWCFFNGIVLASAHLFSCDSSNTQLLHCNVKPIHALFLFCCLMRFTHIDRAELASLNVSLHQLVISMVQAWQCTVPREDEATGVIHRKKIGGKGTLLSLLYSLQIKICSVWTNQ